MLHVKFDTNKILDQFQRKVDVYASFDVDSAVHAALDELADMLLKDMQALRQYVDELELNVDTKYWPYPSYTDLMYSVK